MTPLATLLVQLTSASVLAVLLQQGGALLLRRMNRRTDEAQAFHTEAQAGQVAVQTLVEVVDGVRAEAQRLREQLAEARADADNLREQLATMRTQASTMAAEAATRDQRARAEAEERDRQALAHLRACTAIQDQLRAAGRPFDAPPPLWLDLPPSSG